MPRSASRLYTGRRELSERLAQILSFDPLKPQIQQTFVIIGIGGTGKSEFCLKFAEVHRDEYVEIGIYKFCQPPADNKKLIGTGEFSGLTQGASPRPSRVIST